MSQKRYLRVDFFQNNSYIEDPNIFKLYDFLLKPVKPCQQARIFLFCYLNTNSAENYVVLIF